MCGKAVILPSADQRVPYPGEFTSCRDYSLYLFASSVKEEL